MLWSTYTLIFKNKFVSEDDPWLIKTTDAEPKISWADYEVTPGMLKAGKGPPYKPHSKVYLNPLLLSYPTSRKVKVSQSCRLFVTPWNIKSVKFSRPKYWSG